MKSTKSPFFRHSNVPRKPFTAIDIFIYSFDLGRKVCMSLVEPTPFPIYDFYQIHVHLDFSLIWRDRIYPLQYEHEICAYINKYSALHRITHCFVVFRQVSDLAVTSELEAGVGKCPYSPTHNSTALLLQNGELYSATVAGSCQKLTSSSIAH